MNLAKTTQLMLGDQRDCRHSILAILFNQI